MELIMQTLVVLLPRVPLYLIWIVGIVLAVIYRRRDRRVTLLTAVALTLFLAIDLCNLVVTSTAPSLLQNPDLSFRDVSLVLGITNLASVLIGAGAWIIILVAIFSGRD